MAARSMADPTHLPPWEGFAAAAGAVVQHLASRLTLDLWVVTHVDADQQVVVAAAGPWSPKAAGMSWPWADSLCLRMVGGGPRVAPRAQAVPVYAAAPANRLARIEAYLGVPLVRADGELFGTLCGFGGSPQPDSLTGELPALELHGRLLSTVLAKEQAAHERSVEAAEAYAKAERDPLTGLLNRRGWERSLAVEEARCLRYGLPASIVVINLDDFKRINAEWGHAAGDAYLREAGRLISSARRPTDIVARTGGDEFSVLAVECDAGSAKRLQERLRRDLAGAELGASLGEATREHTDLSSVWQRADHRLHERRQRGHGPGRVDVVRRSAADPRPLLSRLPSGLLAMRDRCLVLMGESGALSSADLVRVTLGDVSVHAEGLQVRVGGRQALIARGEQPENCPVRAFLAWRETLRGALANRSERRSGDAELAGQPVFRAVGPRGRLLPGPMSEQAARAVRGAAGSSART